MIKKPRMPKRVPKKTPHKNTEYMGHQTKWGIRFYPSDQDWDGVEE